MDRPETPKGSNLMSVFPFRKVEVVTEPRTPLEGVMSMPLTQQWHRDSVRRALSAGAEIRRYWQVSRDELGNLTSTELPLVSFELDALDTPRRPSCGSGYGRSRAAARDCATGEALGRHMVM